MRIIREPVEAKYKIYRGICQECECSVESTREETVKRLFSDTKRWIKCPKGCGWIRMLHRGYATDRKPSNITTPFNESSICGGACIDILDKCHYLDSETILFILNTCYKYGVVDIPNSTGIKVKVNNEIKDLPPRKFDIEFCDKCGGISD